jgi:Xaa-Pro aminopeptidase
LVIRELPMIVPADGAQDTILEPGMVVCLENGLSEIGLGSMSVEDIVVVTADGCVPLTSYERSFQEVGCA